MKLFIPTIGTKLVLTADWKFALHHESRNESMFEHTGNKYDEDYWRRNKPEPVPVTLPAGSELTVDRIYIRKGMEDFDSVSFFLVGAKTKTRTEERTGFSVTTITPDIHYPSGIKAGKVKRTPFTYERTVSARKVRFWVKLEDVNGMEVKVLPHESKPAPKREPAAAAGVEPVWKTVR